MPAWAIQILAQLIPVLVPLVLDRLRRLGINIRPTVQTAINGTLGAAVGQLVSHDPLAGMVVAHVAHSALDHSPVIAKV